MKLGKKSLGNWMSFSSILSTKLKSNRNLKSECNNIDCILRFWQQLTFAKYHWRRYTREQSRLMIMECLKSGFAIDENNLLISWFCALCNVRPLWMSLIKTIFLNTCNRFRFFADVLSLSLFHSMECKREKRC